MNEDGVVFALPNEIHAKRCSDVVDDVTAALAAEFYRLMAELGKVPSSADVRKHGHCSLSGSRRPEHERGRLRYQ